MLKLEGILFFEKKKKRTRFQGEVPFEREEGSAASEGVVDSQLSV